MIKKKSKLNKEKQLDDIMMLWNDIKGINKIRSLNSERRTAIRCRLLEMKKKKDWESLFALIGKNPELIKKGWFTFDFVFKNKENIMKIKDGVYDFLKEGRGKNREHDPERIKELTKNNVTYRIKNDFINRKEK